MNSIKNTKQSTEPKSRNEIRRSPILHAVAAYTRRMTVAVFGLILFCCFTQMVSHKTLTRKARATTQEVEKYETFKLIYSYSGLGSGMGSMQPTFRVTGKNYVYTSEQNSYYGTPDKKPVRICEGTLRTSSIDSILNVVKHIKDSVVYKTTIGVMSGGIHGILVQHEKIYVAFRLHNAFDADAQKIVDILNSNIPADKKRLWLFDFPVEK